MAVEVLRSGGSDREIAILLYAVLTEGELTPLREQLLDVIRANIEDLYTYRGDGDEEDS